MNSRKFAIITVILAFILAGQIPFSTVCKDLALVPTAMADDNENSQEENADKNDVANQEDGDKDSDAGKAQDKDDDKQDQKDNQDDQGSGDYQSRHHTLQY